MTHEEIEDRRKDLLDILQKRPGDQNQPLRDLAVKVGAQQPNASRVEFRDMIVNNINHALQTASMIDMCKTSAKNHKIAITAAIIALLSALAAWAAVLAMVLIAIFSR